MKKTILSLFLIFVFTPAIFAQNELTQTQKIAATAKVWGFLKYYHPQVAKGSYNWDKELFKVLPKVKTATNNAIKFYNNMRLHISLDYKTPNYVHQNAA